MSGDSRNIAQLRVHKSTQTVCRGTGYRVGNDLILTAAHVVADADHITLTFNVDLPTQWDVVAEVAACYGDLALLRMQPPSHQSHASKVYAKFGRVGSRVSTVKFTSLGFPVWRLRVDKGTTSANRLGRFRDAAQVTGSFPTASSWREGMLELLVDQPPAEMDLDGDPALAGVESEWEGMSGAAVWAEDRIIGVISAHVRSEGLGHLRATRLEQLFRNDDSSSRAFRELLHLPLGTDSDALADVIPIPHAEKLALEFEGDVREVAPQALLDRDRELEDLAEICLSDEQYVWIQAPAWSGKTALSSWLALNPPPRVAIVAFFIVKRQIGRADVNAFLDSALAQLCLYDSRSEKAPVSLEEKRRRFGSLLDLAAAQCVADGRRLTLLVDGLDEDVSNDIDLPSIASILPTRPIKGLNVLVTGRPISLPIDVHGSHPLRSCRIYALNPSRHAKALEVAAKQELAAILRGDDGLSVEILAFLTVSGGGLTSRELHALTAARKLGDIKNRLEGALARSLAVHSGYGGDSIYLFGHATLAETARGHFFDEQYEYTERLHSWASMQAALGWSKSTPQFLMGRYFRLLSASGVGWVDRMVELATSEERHDLMLDRTNGDWDALAEIELTRAALEAGGDQELEAAAKLSIEHGRLVDRSGSIPLESGPLWARMGDTVRARMTASLITSPLQRSSYLAEIAAALADTGDVIQAREVAEEVSDFRTRLRTLSVVAAKFVERKDYKHAEELTEFLEENARAFPDRSVRADFLTLAAKCFSLAGKGAHADDLGKEAEELAKQFNQPKSPVKGAVEIAARLAAIGQVDRAWRISVQISEPTWHAEALCSVAPYLSEADDRRPLVLKAVYRAREKHMTLELLARTALNLRSVAPELAVEYLSAASSVRGYSSVPSAIGSLAIATAVLDAVSAGVSILDFMQPALRIAWLCKMSRSLTEAGRVTDALHCAELAEVAATAMTTSPDQTSCLIDIADSYFAAGSRARATELVERAEIVARQKVSRSSAKHWATVAVSLARAGRVDCAEIIVDKINSAVDQSDNLRLELVDASAGVGQLDKALSLTRTISDPLQKLKGYLHVLTARARQRQSDLQDELLAEVVQFYETFSELDDDQPEVISLVKHMFMVGWRDKAETIAASFAMADARSAAADAIASAAASMGDFDSALRFTATGFLEAHSSKSLEIDGSGMVRVADALNRADVASAMDGFYQLSDKRLRAIAAKWIRKSSLELSDSQGETVSSFKGSPAYVSGVGRALIEAEMPDRLIELLRADSLHSNGETYLQALIEGVEAAVSKDRADIGIHLLKSSRTPWKQGALILGYCLAAHGKICEAWSVLHDGEDTDFDGLARRIAEAGFLSRSIQGEALVSIAKEYVRDDGGAVSDRLLPLIQRMGSQALMDAIVVFLTEAMHGNLQPDRVQSLVSKLRQPSDRLKVLSQATTALKDRGDSEHAVILVRAILGILTGAPADGRAAMFPDVAHEALSMVATKDAFVVLCQEILSGPRWPGALSALAVLAPAASDRVAEQLARTCPTTAVT